MAAPRHSKKREAFLTALREQGLVASAAKKAGLHRSGPYEWAKRDEAFAKEFDEARAIGREVFADRLESSLAERAITGTTETIFYQGKAVGTRQFYHDVVGIFLLKGARPGVYVEQLVGVGVNVAGQKVNVEIVNYSAGLPAPSSPALAAPTDAEGEPRTITAEVGT